MRVAHCRASSLSHPWTFSEYADEACITFAIQPGTQLDCVTWLGLMSELSRLSHLGGQTQSDSNWQRPTFFQYADVPCTNTVFSISTAYKPIRTACRSIRLTPEDPAHYVD